MHIKRTVLSVLSCLAALQLFAAPRVMPGIEVLEQMGFEPLKG